MKSGNLALGMVGAGYLVFVLVGVACRPPAAPEGAEGGVETGAEPSSVMGGSASASASASAWEPPTNMVRIVAGSFRRMNQRVSLSQDFWVARFEVTQGDYLELMGKNPSHFSGDLARPVEKVSQVDAVAYCEALTRRERGEGRLPTGYEYRLPTEAEWEYACRAGSTNRYSFGDEDGEAGAYAWTEENSDMTSHPVGQKLPNAWGLHDMHGNVWEWCSDWFVDYPPGDLVDPRGPGAGEYKVFRGGGWNQAAKFGRCSNRFMMKPGTGIHFVGFRVVLGRVGVVP